MAIKIRKVSFVLVVMGLLFTAFFPQSTLAEGVSRSSDNPIEMNKETFNTFSLDNNYLLTKKSPIYEKRSDKLEHVGYFEKGEIIKGNEYSKEWILINFGGKPGYINRLYLEPTEKNPYAPKEQKKNIGMITVVQDTPVFDNKRSPGKWIRFASLEKGIVYPYTSISGDWYEVSVNGLTGWVHKNEVTVLTDSSSSSVYFQTTKDHEPVYELTKGKRKLVGYLKKNEIYQKIKVIETDWYQIPFGETTAVVNKKYMISANKPNSANQIDKTVPTEGYFRVISDAPVFDNKRGERLVPFFTLKKGVEYPYIGKLDDNWFTVVIGKSVGYVHKNNIKLLPPKDSPYITPVENEVSIYDNSTGSLVQIAVLNQGDVIKILGEYGENWYELQFDRRKAYIRKQLVEKAFGDTLKNISDTNLITSGFVQTVEDVVPVYDNSSGKLVPFLYLNKNQIYGYTTKLGTNWYQIQAGHRIGYIASKAVSEITPKKISIEQAHVYSTYESAIDYRYQNNKIETISFNSTVGVLEQKGYVSKVITMSGKTGWMYSASLLNSPSDMNWIVREARVLRAQPTSTSSNLGTVPADSKVVVLNYQIGNDSVYKHWYQVKLSNGASGWIWGAKTSNSTGAVIHPYDFSIIKPANQLNIHNPIDTIANITADEINAFLDYKTRWHVDRSQNCIIGMGPTFIKASEETGMNVLYLVSHAALETGWGTSEIVSKKFNYFGIAAYDRDPYGNAYSFVSKESGITEGARWINNNYITKGQNTLNSMRNNNNYHQYATDEAWHLKISNIANDLATFVEGMRK